MQELSTVVTTPTSREAWIEPEVRQLDVRETAFRPHGGGDGETRYADCNRS